MLVGKEIGFTDSMLIGIAGLCVVILELAIIAVLIVMLSKVIKLLLEKNKTTAVNVSSAVSPVPAANAVLPAVNQTTGSLKLTNVDDKTAAVVIAIVSNESGIPLDRLSFKSIKEI